MSLVKHSKGVGDKYKYWPTNSERQHYWLYSYIENICRWMVLHEIKLPFIYPKHGLRVVVDMIYLRCDRQWKQNIVIL